MVLTENSSTMNLLQDSEGNINIHEIKASTSGTKIVSNNIFNNRISSSADEQNYLPNKYVDITTESQNEKDVLSSLNEDELNKIVTDMVEQEHTLQNLSPIGLVQQSIIQEQAQLLSSYNDIIDLPKDVQQEIKIKPIQEKETLDVENTQQIHKSHLPPWISKEYTKLIRPSKDSHMVTLKKKEPLNVYSHTNVTPILPHEVIKKDISPGNYIYHKNISNPCKKINIDEENQYLVDKTEEKKELKQKDEVTITRIRGDHKNHKKVIKRDLKDEHQENAIPHVSTSLIGALNLTVDKKCKSNISFHMDQPLKIEKESVKLDNLSEVTMSNSNENIVFHPPIPIFSSGELPLAKPSTSTDSKTREQMIMIQELQTMVPHNIYPQQSLKTFENGNVLLVAPLSANESNHHRRLIKPKSFVSNIKSDPSSSDEKVVIEDSVAAYKHYTSLHGSMPMLDETNEQYDDVRNKLPNKRKLSDDSLLYDMRIGIEGIEMKEKLHYEDSNPCEEKRKRCRYGIKKEKKWQLEEELSDAEEEKKRQNAKKAKEHREKKKDEITTLKNENMQWQLKCRELEAENKQLKSQVEMLKSIFPTLNVKSIPET